MERFASKCESIADEESTVYFDGAPEEEDEGNNFVVVSTMVSVQITGSFFQLKRPTYDKQKLSCVKIIYKHKYVNCFSVVNKKKVVFFCCIILCSETTTAVT